MKNLLKLISETKAEAKSKFAIENDMTCASSNTIFLRLHQIAL